MRTSNKILLGIFLGPLLILTILHLTLYAKYKSGNYVVMKTVQEDKYTRIALKNIHHISVYGLNDFSVMPADSSKLEIEKDKEGHLHYTINGDSLVIHGDSIVIAPGQPNGMIRSSQAVNLYIPASANISADNSEITLEGSKDSLHANSYSFSLVNDASLKVNQNGDDSARMYFSALKIQASHSSGIELTANSRVFDLTIAMIKSEFTDNGATIDALHIDADNLSNITLKGDNLKKLNTGH